MSLPPKNMNILKEYYEAGDKLWCIRKRSVAQKQTSENLVSDFMRLLQ